MDKAIVIRRNIGQYDLLSSLGSGLKETSITGYLGYLLSLKPIGLLKLLKISRDIIISIKIERYLETQRCDITVETYDTTYIIEAKLYYENPIPQLLKQKKELSKFSNKKIKLIGITNNKSIKDKKILILNWNDVYSSLNNNFNEKIKILSEEFKMHLKNNGLSTIEVPDIYARDVGGKDSLNMFLKANVYYCPYSKKSKIEKCKYFAPCFSKDIIKISPGVNYGISYIAKIDGIEYVENNNDFKKIVLEHIKTKKLKSKYPEAEKIIKGISFDFKKPLIVLLLNKPRLLFNPPISKNKLQEGYGWLSKRYYSFEEFFDAANL